MINFDEYIRQDEPQKREKGYAWQTAIGLQAVDDLTPPKLGIKNVMYNNPILNKSDRYETARNIRCQR